MISSAALKWAAVATGAHHTAAISTDGSLWSWGYNGSGQIGINTYTAGYYTPQQEDSKSKWTAVSAGRDHTAAIRSDGTLWAWGVGDYGQRGDGTWTVIRTVPVQEASLDTRWVAVAAGVYHTVALKSDGTLWAWGRNTNGQLGDGTTTAQNAPVQEQSHSTQWRAIAAGLDHTVALKSDGTLWAWGSNFSGQAGNNASNPQLSPIQVGTDATWASIAAGYYFSVATKTDGTAWEWGTNAYGLQGNGSGVPSVNSPVQVGTDNHWAGVSAGGYAISARKVADGALAAYARYQDVIGNWSAALTSKQTILDATAPTGTIEISSGATYTTGTSVTLTLSCSDDSGITGASSGCSQMQFKNDNDVSWSTAEPIGATKTWSLLASDGTRTVNARFLDGAGNASTVMASIILDRVAPTPGTVVISGATQTNNAAVTLTLNATGASQMQFSNNSNGPWSPLVPYGTSQPWNLNDPAYGGLVSDGTKTVYARYQDAAGNLSSTVTGTITYDSTAPTGTLTFHNLTTYSTTTTVQLDLTCSEAGTGCSQMQFSNDGTTWLPASPAAWSSPYAWTLPNGDGTKTVYARFKDGAGNWSSTVISKSVILDTTAPTGTITINNLATYATSTAVTLALTCSDANGCGQMQFKNDSGSWSTLEPYTASKTWNLQSLDGLRTVSVQFIDAAGNMNTAAATITLDRVAPTPGTVVISGAPKTNNAAVTLTLNATGASQMQFSNNSNGPWSPLVTYGTSRLWNLNDPAYGGLVSDGTKTVYAQYQDAAGNLSSAVTGTITYDSTAPTGTLTFHNLTTYSTTTNIQLDLTCSDAGTGCSQMQFSNDGTTWLPVSPASWSSTYAWTLPNGDGTKTVYVRFKDGAGNWSSTVISKSVILDATVPTGTITINNLATYATSTAVTLALTCSDANGCSQMQFKNDSGSWSMPADAFAAAKSWNLQSLDGLRTVSVQFIDAAGDTGTAAAAITLDRVAPTPGTVVISGAPKTNNASVDPDAERDRGFADAVQ